MVDSGWRIKNWRNRETGKRGDVIFKTVINHRLPHYLIAALPHFHIVPILHLSISPILIS